MDSRVEQTSVVELCVAKLCVLCGVVEYERGGWRADTRCLCWSVGEYGILLYSHLSWLVLVERAVIIVG